MHLPEISARKETSHYCLGTFDGFFKKNLPGELFIFYHDPFPLNFMYAFFT
jgi:hypothetical protein